MTEEISTLNTEAVGQGSAQAAVVDSPSQTAAQDALAADDAAIFGGVQKQASDTVEKQTPVTTGQDNPSSEDGGEAQAVTTPQGETTQGDKTKPTEELSDEAIDALPEAEKQPARTKRAFDRLRGKLREADERAATERQMREEVEKKVREELQAKSATVTQQVNQPAIPQELWQARVKAEQEWNRIISEVQSGTKTEADALPAWNAVQDAYRKEGAWAAEQQLKVVQQQQATLAQAQREQNEALSTLASLAGDDPRFDMIDDIADVSRRANPQTPFGKMVHDLCMAQYNRPVQTWAELEGFALKAAKLIDKGKRTFADTKAQIAEKQTRAMLMRTGLESSNRHSPPPRSVKSDNSDLRKRLDSTDPKIRAAARYELFESEARAHGLA